MFTNSLLVFFFNPTAYARRSLLSRPCLQIRWRKPHRFDRVKGAYAWDVDGNKFIDYVGTWGPAILGHADDDVLDAVKKTMDKGELPK